MKYAEDVLKGKIPACEYVKLAIKRHQKDLERDWEYYFDEVAAMKPINFYSELRHYKGRYAGKKFTPLDWQALCLYIFFGWKRKSDDMRRFNYALIEVPKKNGKTHFAAAGAIYHMLMDKEASPEVYCVASRQDQARLALDASRELIRSTPGLENHLKVYQHHIAAPSGGIMKAISSEHKRSQGINVSMAILDEIGDWDTLEMFYSVIKTGTGYRDQPIVWMITTASSSKNHPYYHYRKEASDVLRGIIDQENLFAMIYTIDEDDDWKEKSSWIKANPSWGESVHPVNFEQEAKEAIQKASQQVDFKTRRLNIWCDAPSVWIPDDIWMENDGNVEESDLVGVPCYGGLDLASYKDLSALVLYWPSLKCCRCWFWIPEAKVFERKDSVDYYVWVDEGLMNVFQSETLDSEKVAGDILELCDNYKIVRIGYDRKFSSEVVRTLENHGLQGIMDPYAQLAEHMNAPARKLEKLIYDREFNHGGNPVLRWNISNTVMTEATGGLIRPDKKRSPDKIDGTVSLIMAVGESMTDEYVQETTDPGNLYILDNSGIY